MLSSFAGTDLFEIMRHLVASRTERFKICTGSLEERQAAFEALQEGGTLVVDATALFTLLLLDRAEVLGVWLNRPIVSQKTREHVAVLLEEAQQESPKGVLGLDDQGNLVATQATAEQQAAYAGRLSRLLGAVDKHCQVFSCPQLATLSPEKRHELVEAFGDGGSESIVLASEPKRILWTDDWVLAGYGLANYRNRRVWTQIVLHGAAAAGNLDWNVFNADTAQLLSANYVFTWWTSQVFEQVANEAGWRFSSPLLRPLLDDLKSPSILPEARVVLSAAAIRSCFHSNLGPRDRNGFIVGIMNRLTVLQDSEWAMMAVLKVLKKICTEDPETAKDARWVILVWLQMEMNSAALHTAYSDLSVIDPSSNRWSDT